MALLAAAGIGAWIALSHPSGDIGSGGGGDAGGAAVQALKADKVLLRKGERRLDLLRGERVLRSYRVALGRAPVGPKRREGDGRTPEGAYLLDWRNPKSRYYRSIHVSYPNAADAKRARAAGVDPGGEIMIHGLPPGRGWLGAAHRRADWTEGCIAVTNDEIDEIWALVEDGTPIEIRP